MSPLAGANAKTWVGAAVVVGAAGLLYFLTAARDIVVGDAPELITAAAVLGVPHPPGYPLFTMVGHIFSLLPWGSIPFRVNLLSVLCDSLTVGIVYFTAVRLVRSWLAAAVAALTLTVSSTFWSSSLVAEVFPLNNFLAALLVLLLVTWHQQPERGGILVSSFFVAGLALTNQQTVVLLAPAFCFVMWQHRSILCRQPRLLAIGIAAFVIGLLPYAYIPWASARHPAYNWGNVSSLHDFISLITRSSFGSRQLVGKAEYLGGSPVARIVALCRSFGPVAGILVLLGAVQAYRRVRWYFWFSLIAFVCTGPLFIWIANLNLKTTPFALFVLQRFFLLPQVVAAPLIAFGLLMVADLIGRYVAAVQISPLRLIAGACLVAISVTVLRNYQRVDQSGNFIARRFAEDIFTSAEPGSILLATGDAIVFPVTYLQTVEGLGREVTLISLPMFSQPWYVHQLRERYSDLVIPFEYYDARSNNLELLVDANPSRTACFVVVVGNDDHSLDNSYWPYQRGLLTLIEPRSKSLSMEDLLNENEQLLQRYRPPIPGTVRRETFERDILLAYAWPAFQIASICERAGAKNEARKWYQRALQVDPEFSQAREGLARLGILSLP
jgi:Protein of unknown function (DUF2723)